ncbi:MAG: VOC family protein [Rhizomicrobium sp.]
MQANVYLMFKGNCEEAFKYYAKVTGGKIEAMMIHKGSPAEAQTPAEWHNKILHANLKIGNTSIMASDASPGRQYKENGGFCVSLGVDTPAEAERIFNGLSDGGSVGMPMAETFFAEKFGMCTDRFGTPWMVVCEKKMS